MAIGIAIGVAIGAGLGAVTDNMAMGVAIGIAIGAGIGAAMSQQASKTEQQSCSRASPRCWKVRAANPLGLHECMAHAKPYSQAPR